jgi:tetrahydrodipicolinate N-succinyltransferase
MTTVTLGNASLEAPTTKAEFSSLIASLSEMHPGLREQGLFFFLRSEKKGEAPRYVASMVGEGKFGTLHLLFEVLGRPSLTPLGFVHASLSSASQQALLKVFAPFESDDQKHPNIEFLKESSAQGSAVTVGICAVATDQAKANPDYLRFRTTSLFDLFNEGALRGSDGAARQALLDSFSYLPNRYLSASGRFMESPSAEPQFVRAVPSFEELPSSETGAPGAGGIDKFPSLVSVRGDRLKVDGNRIVPSVMIRDGVYVGKRNIFMFHAAVNIAAYIGDDNMIDSHASIASSAQIGNKNKIGSFVSLEGVLSPANAQPVLIGDENFIGSFARIGTGITVGNKNFIGAGVNLSKGTKLKDCREKSDSRGSYVNAQDLNGAFDSLALAPNNADREFQGVRILPGEYIVFDNSEEFMKRFEGDDRIKAKS